MDRDGQPRLSINEPQQMIFTPNLDVATRASDFVTNFFTSSTNRHLYFHNIKHTVQVVNACHEISLSMHLSPKEVEILELAAWFHDTGYMDAPEDHERCSRNLATRFLVDCGYPMKDLTRVNALIMATMRMHTPNNVLEQVIKDADSYHLSESNFWEMSDELRTELEWSGQIFTDEAWLSHLRRQFNEHHYFTPYGEMVLEPRKNRNFKTYLVCLGAMN